ncbi:uncharacterized protein LOC136028631 isoform X1 [Artemia franciscana]
MLLKIVLKPFKLVFLRIAVLLDYLMTMPLTVEIFIFAAIGLMILFSCVIKMRQCRKRRLLEETFAGQTPFLLQDIECGINKSCDRHSQCELASAISRVEKKIIIDYIYEPTIEIICESVKMKDLFKCFLNCTNNSKSHYFDFYIRARTLDVSLNVEELKGLYNEFLDHYLPESKKISFIRFDDEKRLIIRSYTTSPEPSKVEEVRIILKDVIFCIFCELQEVFTRQFVPEVKKHIGLDVRRNN